MKIRPARTNAPVAIAAALVLLALPSLAQTAIKPAGGGNADVRAPQIDPSKAKTFNPPRLPDGHPNLEGIWQPRTSGAAYSILPHQGGFFLGTGTDKGIV